MEENLSSLISYMIDFRVKCLVLELFKKNRKKSVFFISFTNKVFPGKIHVCRSKIRSQ